LKTQNLKTSDYGVSPNPHQRTSKFHERLGSFPSSYSSCSKQCDHYGHILTGCLTITIIYQNWIFAFLIIAIINVMPEKGLVWILIPAPFWLPPIGNSSSLYRPCHLLYVVLDRLLSGFGLVTNRARSIVYIQLLLGYNHCCYYHFLRRRLLLQ
jgi:hypothetical protein